jgi:flagellar biosynthesis chaperone FliJ
MQDVKQQVIAEIYRVKQEYAKQLAALVDERNKVLDDYKKTLNGAGQQ